MRHWGRRMRHTRTGTSGERQRGTLVSRESRSAASRRNRKWLGLPLSSVRLSAGDLVFALDRSRNVDPRADVELAEDVADVRLDRLLAEEQLAGNLAVGLAIDDQPGDLKLALGQ